jgi:hypothetical protein
MNVEVSDRNLLELAEWMESQSIEYYICYGTLIGAIRDGDFIADDTDTDVVMHEKFLGRFADVLMNGGVGRLRVIRNESAVISFEAEGEYIDVYPYRESDGLFYKYGLDKPKYDILKQDMQPGNFVTLRGRRYPTIMRPEKYLDHWYGDWHVNRTREWCISNNVYGNWDKAISP